MWFCHEEIRVWWILKLNKKIAFMLLDMEEEEMVASVVGELRTGDKVVNVGDGTTIMNNLLQHLKEMNDPSNARISDGDGTCWLMHIAAAKGGENCVVLLLDYGADPNSIVHIPVTNDSDDDCIVISNKTSNKLREIVPQTRATGFVKEERETNFISDDDEDEYHDDLDKSWSLHCRGTGGILGDDMGLGKTMQICSYLAGLFNSRLIKRVLVLSPKTLLPHWIKELSVVGLSRKTKEQILFNFIEAPRLQASVKRNVICYGVFVLILCTDVL
ncbi:hypothetical protein MKW98_031405 [Papaver atlanticum]|uniref:SNF2 N-terminal domain-containing protein n=1 Tax=Papaver atlanticum TaxID=357466 RepID=A0AAD4X9K0_9MAGN|nr:hypothetical protein MKW98_031405 [Papaver atlanticum]